MNYLVKLYKRITGIEDLENKIANLQQELEGMVAKKELESMINKEIRYFADYELDCYLTDIQSEVENNVDDLHSRIDDIANNTDDLIEDLTNDTGASISQVEGKIKELKDAVAKLNNDIAMITKMSSVNGK